jgi:hypothetical protein
VERVVCCHACGAELALTHHLAKECAYCGSANVLVADNERALEQPDGFLPSSITKDQAAQAIRAAIPSRQQLTGLRGVYVPFWVFDGVVEARMRWLHGDGNMSDSIGALPRHLRYDNLVFPGVDVPPVSSLDQVPPYDLGALVPYTPHLLADWPAQLTNLDVELVAEDAYDAMVALAAHQAGAPIEHGSKPTPDARAIRTMQVSRTTYQLVLLPLWLGLLRSRIGPGLALVNGQTGKVILGLILPSVASRSMLKE